MCRTLTNKQNFFYDEENNDNNGIKLIKEFIKNMYYAYGKEFKKKMIKLIQ